MRFYIIPVVNSLYWPSNSETLRNISSKLYNTTTRTVQLNISFLLSRCNVGVEKVVHIPYAYFHNVKNMRINFIKIGRNYVYIFS